jgi:DNA-binding CsgD family transcriptional regulator
MAAVAEQLVGRAAELGALERAVAELNGGPAALALVGEPGIGKTRLLEELGSRADERGLIVLSGSASELERELPFWIFVDALDEYVQGLDPRRLRSIGDETLAELSHILPSLPAAESGPPPTMQDERYRTHGAVCRLLEALAAAKPLALLLDDLHWADSGSVELLGALLRRPPSGPVLIAMTMRPHQLSERLFGAIERARREGKLTQLELGALSADEARELLGEVDGSAAAELHREAGGNPFYLEQLARSPRLGEAGGHPGARAISLAGVEVPRAVAAALTEELSLLDDATRRVLEGAAVSGEPFEPELAAAAAGVPEAAAMDALDELLGRDLVRRTDVPRRFRFRHPLVRRAVYEAAPAGWLLGAHERTGAALAARGAPAVERAHHLERSARQGDLEAVAVLREAGVAAARRTPATAARLFEGALRILPATAPCEERAGLLEALAGAQVAVGLIAEPHALLLQSQELRKDDPLAARVRLTAVLASLENLLGRHRDAHRRLLEAYEALPPGASTEAVALLIELAVDGFYRMDYDAMRDFAQRALDASAGLDNRQLRAGALGMLAMGQVLCGSVRAAEATCTEGAQLVDSMPDDEIARTRRAINNLAPAELYIGRYEQASAHSERAFAVAHATGQGQFLPTLFWTGVTRIALGRLAAAIEVLDAAVEIARVSGHAQGVAWNLAGRSVAAAAAGDAETALATAEEAVEAVRGMDRTFPSTWAGFALAGAAFQAGQPERALEVLLDSAGGGELPLLPAPWKPGGFELMARSQLALGRREEAERGGARARAVADALGLPLAAAMADRAAAALALDAGDAAGAAELALASAERAGEVGAVVEAALARLLAGDALAAAGEKERAIEELQRAAGEFDRLGAVGHRDDAERRLGRLGRRPHRRTRKGKSDGVGLEALTERELEVARLVVDRKTNSQIAQELFLSPKTVETHIRHLFQKLEVSSRVDVARVVERAERDAH